jgi:16S rRNA (guanine966-N2)-methyltransferase
VPRIVAGAARGRRIAAPPGRATRPTADRAREGLFSALEAQLGSFAGRRVADLYAGTGAVGLEALSRGAAAVLLVESDPAAVRVLRANVAAVGLPGAEVRTGRVERVVAAPPGTTCAAAYDVVFLDPPYEVADADLRAVLRDALAHRWVVKGGLVVVERASRGGGWAWPDGLEGLRSRTYGEATLWYGRAALSDSPGE